MQIRTSVVAVGVLIVTGYLLVGAAPQVAHPVGVLPVTGMSPAIKPQDIVNIDSENLGLPLYIQQGGELTLLTVPSGRWFIMTNFEGIAPGIELDEVAGSVTTVKRGRTWLAGGALGLTTFVSAIGLAFSPGSQVVLRNINTSSSPSPVFTLSGLMVGP